MTCSAASISLDAAVAQVIITAPAYCSWSVYQPCILTGQHLPAITLHQLHSCPATQHWACPLALLALAYALPRSGGSCGRRARRAIQRRLLRQRLVLLPGAIALCIGLVRALRGAAAAILARGLRLAFRQLWLQRVGLRAPTNVCRSLLLCACAAGLTLIQLQSSLGRPRQQLSPQHLHGAHQEALREPAMMQRPPANAFAAPMAAHPGTWPDAPLAGAR